MNLKALLFLACASCTGFAVTSPAHATAEIYCKATDGRSGEIQMNVGRLPVLRVVSATVTAFGKTWSTREGIGTEIIVGQAFEDRHSLRVDFTDPNVESVLISLRTVRVSTEKESGEAGILRIANAVYPVMCES